MFRLFIEYVSGYQRHTFSKAGSATIFFFYKKWNIFLLLKKPTKNCFSRYKKYLGCRNVFTQNLQLQETNFEASFTWAVSMPDFVVLKRNVCVPLKKENRTNKAGSLDQKHQKRTKDGFIGKICSQCLSPDIWKLCLP